MALLDKFIDPRTREHRVNPVPNGESSQIKSILWNLQNILQTRRTADKYSNLGLMDFCEHSLSDSLMLQLCCDIQQQIQQHEKRLCDVQVSLFDSKKNCWHISVAARLVSKPASDVKGNLSFILELAKSA